MFSFYNGILHLNYNGRSRKFTVPVPGISPTPTGGRIHCMGKRPPLRALRGRQPQVQACRVTKRVQPSPTQAAQYARVQAWQARSITAHPASQAAQGSPTTW